jgi:putative oxidoreductase
VKNLIAFLNSQRDVGALILRVLGGFILLYSGYLKLFVAGFSNVIGAFERMGMVLPQLTGPFIALLEFFGGIAVILGLATRYLGVLFTIEFLVAFFFVKIGRGYMDYRIDLALIAFAVLWATHGAGKLSLDRKLKLEP